MALSGRAYDVLVHLVENRERVVTKDDLLKAVWPRVVVEENNLNQAISVLRRTLGDSRESPKFILTVAGRGFRFIADVTNEPSLMSPGAAGQPEVVAIAAPAPAPSPPRTAPESVTRRSVIVGLGVAGVLGTSAVLWRSRPTGNRQLPTTIAVLPFAPLIGGSGDEALELGMADTLINRLSVLPGVVVTPFSSVRRYAGINQNPVSAGRELAVAAVIEGHVQVRHDRVRLTARLLRVADGSALWSGSFDERLSDFFSVQDLLAQQLVDALALDVPDAARRRLVRNFTDDVEAWQLYLNGRYHWDTRMTEDGLRRAREYYEAASRLDPGFALPVVGLADVWAVLGVFGIVPPVEAFTSAMEAARRAIGLDAKLAEAHASLGHSLTQFERDWRGGERLYRYALTLKPSYGQAMMWLANNQLFQGHLRKALEDGRHAQLLEPASLTFAANVGMIDYFLRDYAAAEKQLTKLVEAVPAAGLPRRHLARVRLAQGDGKAALALLDGIDPLGPGWFSDLGRAYAAAGRDADARSEIKRLEEFGRRGFGVGYDIALIRMGLREPAGALDALERCIDDHSQLVGFINVEPCV